MKLPNIFKSKPRTENYRLGGSGFYEMSVPPGMSYQSYLDSYGQVGWLFGGVSVIANAVAEVGWHLYQVRNGDRNELDNHPALDLLNKVNPFQTRYEFIQLLVTYRKLVGDSYIVLNNNLGGKPSEMWLASPSYMSPIPHPTQYIAGYLFERGTNKVTFDLNEVIRIKDPNPSHPLAGLGAAQSIGVDIDSERHAARYQNKLFYNDGRPGMILSIDEDYPGDDKAKEIEKYWNQKFRGTSNAYKVAFLWGKTTPHMITLSNKDMDFKELRHYSRDTILGAYHIPLSVMGITENVNRANAEAGEYTFAKRVIKPELTQIREAFNEQLCPLFGDNLEFDFDDPVPANREQMVTETVSLLTAGVITREMACQNLGYDIPTDGTYLMPFSVTEVEVGKAMANSIKQKGGEGSGNFGHEGRPGEVGGSGEGGGGTSEFLSSGRLSAGGKGPSREINESTKERTATVLKERNIPGSHLDCVNKITVDKDKVAELGLMTDATFNTNTNEITLGRFGDEAVVHEVGHAVFNKKIYVPNNDDKFTILKAYTASTKTGKGFPSAYSRENPVEYFAECYDSYSKSPSSFKKKNPVMGKVLDKYWE